MLPVLGATRRSGRVAICQRLGRHIHFQCVAPPLAPLLFADIGTIGLIVMLDPVEQPAEEAPD